MTQQTNNYRLKLLYFEDRGNADLIKLLFSISDQPFESVQIKQSEWNSYKSFMPFEQLPVLVINDDIRIAQTNTICRFLANLFKLEGCNNIEKSQSDMVNEQLKECADYTVKNLHEFDQLKKQQQTTHFITNILPKTLNGYEKLLSLNTSKFIVGNSLTWADLALVNAWEWLDDYSKQIVARYPLIKGHNDYIRSIPKVSAWFSSQKPLRIFKMC